MGCTVPGVDDFFASRSGVCVYVTSRGHKFRIQFVAADAMGVVVEGPAQGADEALECARVVMQTHRTELAKLFERVARGRT
jgi:hypothetical protein